MIELTKEDVRHWVKHGGPAELRDICEAMAQLWRQGLITLNRREDGEVVAATTEVGRLSDDGDAWVQ
jgi:hypothetical protein